MSIHDEQEIERLRGVCDKLREELKEAMWLLARSEYWVLNKQDRQAYQQRQRALESKYYGQD